MPNLAENPFFKMRFRRGWKSRRKAAIALDIDQSTVTHIENGGPYAIGSRVIARLDAAGENGSAIAKSYRRWRAKGKA